MTYNEFVCECVIRLGAVISFETGKPSFQPQGCLSRALDLAETLVKPGFISPTFELLRRKFEAYRDAMLTAYTARTNEQMYQYRQPPPLDPEKRKEIEARLGHEDPDVRKAAREALQQREEKLALSLSSDVLKAIQRSVDAKSDFYAVANLLMPELIEQVRKVEARKRGADVSISSAAEPVLEFFRKKFFHKNSVFENEEGERDLLEEEQELIDNLERHKMKNEEARRIHEALIASREAERRVIEELGATAHRSS